MRSALDRHFQNTAAVHAGPGIVRGIVTAPVLGIGPMALGPRVRRATPRPVGQGVVRHLPQPRAKPTLVGRVIEPRHGGHQPREYILHDVLGVVDVDAPLADVGQQQWFIDRDEFGPGSRIGPIPDALEQ